MTIKGPARAALVLGAILLVLVSPAPTAADDWLVYLGGGLEPIEGGWTERHGSVVFRKTNGQLVSVAYTDVDLATSAFVSWQLSANRHTPPRSPVVLPEGTNPDSADDPDRLVECERAEVVRIVDSETLDVRTANGTERIHVACLDAPETEHQFSELGWFGRATLSAVEIEVKPGAEVCLLEHTPQQRDRDEHRIVHVTLPDGRDYASEVIAAGLGLLRVGACERGPTYRSLEDRAMTSRKGLWGPMGRKPAFAIARNTIAIGGSVEGVPLPRRRRAGGG